VHDIVAFNSVLLTGQMCDYATDRENIFFCSVLDLFHIRVMFIKCILQFFKSKNVLAWYIVAYHKQMYFELGVFHTFIMCSSNPYKA
jgi:hypothetical protein